MVFFLGGWGVGGGIVLFISVLSGYCSLRAARREIQRRARRVKEMGDVPMHPLSLSIPQG